MLGQLAPTVTRGCALCLNDQILQQAAIDQLQHPAGNMLHKNE
jgi:hypothetical protein